MKIGRALLRAVMPVAATLLVAACVRMQAGPPGAAVTSGTGPGNSGVPAPANDQAWLPKAEALGAHLTPWAPLVLSTPTPVAVSTEEPEATPTPAPADVTEAGTGGEATSTPAARMPSGAPAAAVTGVKAAASVHDVALARIPDVDPAPPLTITVDGVRLADGGTYEIAGSIRNDGTQTYEDIGIEATFYTTDPWHYGPFDAALNSYTLAPGQSCAFVVQAYARDYTGYRLHAGGSPVKAWTGSSAPLTVVDAHVVDQTAGLVHLAGVVRNDTGSTVGNARVSGQLVDAGGVVTSIDTTVVVGTLAPGAETGFDVRVPAAAYATFVVTAEGDLR